MASRAMKQLRYAPPATPMISSPKMLPRAMPGAMPSAMPRAAVAKPATPVVRPRDYRLPR